MRILDFLKNNQKFLVFLKNTFAKHTVFLFVNLPRILNSLTVNVESEISQSCLFYDQKFWTLFASESCICVDFARAPIRHWSWWYMQDSMALCKIKNLKEKHLLLLIWIPTYFDTYFDNVHLPFFYLTVKQNLACLFLQYDCRVRMRKHTSVWFV